MSKNRSDQWLQETEILAEFQNEDKALAQELINLRQTPGAALHRHVAQIPYHNVHRPWVTVALGHRLRVAAVWTTTVVMLVVVLLFAFPQLRTAAAKTIADIWASLRLGMSGTAGGFVTFSPAPPFDVYQPEDLPEGFALSVQYYQPLTEPETGASSLMAEVLENAESGVSSSGLGPELITAHQIDEPHIILFYEAGDGRYLLLLERSVHAGEGLPTGEVQQVNDHPATLQRSGETLTLTWVTAETWLTLDGTLTEDELLRVAESMIVTQRAGESRDVSLTEDAGADTQPPFCDPDEPQPSGFLLGEMQDQQYWGSVWIHLFDRERFPESVGHGINLGSVTPVLLFQQALEAMQEPGLTMMPLSYSSLGHFTITDDDVPCLQPDPRLQGYIAIEVWDEQVNVGFGGDGAALKDRAIQALVQELENLR
jgi:hypothetical protein